MSSRSGYSSQTQSRSRALSWRAAGPGRSRRARPAISWAQYAGHERRALALAEGCTLLNPAESVPFAPTSGSVHDTPVAVQTLRARSRRNHPGAHVQASDVTANAVVEPLRASRPLSGLDASSRRVRGFGAALGEASVQRSCADADVAAVSVADGGPWRPRSMARARRGQVARKPVGRVRGEIQPVQCAVLAASHCRGRNGLGQRLRAGTTRSRSF